MTPGHDDSFGVPRVLVVVRKPWSQPLLHDTTVQLDISRYSPKDTVELVDLRVTGEERLLGDHLGENDADGPNVHRRAVDLLAEQDLRRAVPQRDHLVRVLLDREAEGARQLKSAILSSPVLFTSRFCGFKSLHAATNTSIRYYSTASSRLQLNNYIVPVHDAA